MTKVTRNLSHSESGENVEIQAFASRTLRIRNSQTPCARPPAYLGW